KMTKMQNARQRIELERKAEELRQVLRQRGRIAVEQAPDQIDHILLAAERESATLALERTSRLLRQVEFALERFRTGDYGSCIKCESDISEKRLNAIPWALYCIKCQEAVDELHRRVESVWEPAA